MFHDFCSIPAGRDPAKIMKRPSGKKWVLRRFAQMELLALSLPKGPKGISDTEKYRNMFSLSFRLA